ncbi:7743_t:CDS:2 [Entrophospora sp. SA101]|nr:12845_t:CDS:2 [Entrophospora sp. SA101]CAJ0872136.1 7743_t:CDS:2 [Entrophospora sp. SA101]
MTVDIALPFVVLWRFAKPLVQPFLPYSNNSSMEERRVKQEQVQESGGSLEKTTLKQLKERLKKITGVPVNGQKIIFSGAVMKDEIATLGSFGLHHNSKILLIGTKPNANDLAATSSNSSEEHALIQKITQLLHKSKTTLIPQIESFETSSLLVLDGIDFSSNNSSQEFTIARQKRRDAVKFTQQLIDRVDEVKEKLLKANISNSNSGGGGGVLEGAGTGVGIAEDGNVERRNVEGEN